MGWSSGTSVAIELWEELESKLKKSDKQSVARRIINILEDHDWDGRDEVEDLVNAAGWAPVTCKHCDGEGVTRG